MKRALFCLCCLFGVASASARQAGDGVVEQSVDVHFEEEMPDVISGALLFADAGLARPRETDRLEFGRGTSVDQAPVLALQRNVRARVVGLRTQFAAAIPA